MSSPLTPLPFGITQLLVKEVPDRAEIDGRFEFWTSGPVNVYIVATEDPDKREAIVRAFFDEATGTGLPQLQAFPALTISLEPSISRSEATVAAPRSASGTGRTAQRRACSNYQVSIRDCGWHRRPPSSLRWIGCSLRMRPEPAAIRASVVGLAQTLRHSSSTISQRARITLRVPEKSSKDTGRCGSPRLGTPPPGYRLRLLGRLRIRPPVRDRSRNPRS